MEDKGRNGSQPKLPYLSKEEAQDLIRAAGHKESSESLQQLIQSNGYTAQQLDALSDTCKTPLHQACWKGTLKSIKYLVEEVGCNVNVYSQQTFSYGKTAIFFALTQSRREVVQYLLSRPDINVSIVNNKGQSVLTLAASHGIPVQVLREIQSKEQTDLSNWWNFRATHSDLLEYGDLDPRFLERPLKDTDVVTEYAVNGTTKQSRKGAFQRRNPEAAKEWQRHRQQQSQGKKSNKSSTEMGTSLSKDQQQAIDTSWQVLSNRTNSTDMELLHAVLTIIEQSDGLRKPWIPEMASRLLQLGYDYDQISRLSLAANTENGILQEDPMMKDDDDESGKNIGRKTSLFLKLLNKLQGDDDDDVADSKDGMNQSLNKKDHSKDTTSSLQPIPTKGFGASHQEWIGVAFTLQHLSISSLESSDSNTEKKELKLHSSIASTVYVNEYKSLRTLWDRLQTLTKKASLDHPFVLAIDSEWATAEQSDGSTELQLSTLQLAFCDPSNEEIPISVYILDLLVVESEENKVSHDDSFHDLVQKMVHWMIYGSYGDHCSSSDNMWLLGFALGHDLRMLREYCNRQSSDMSLHANKQWRSQILDLQMLLRERRKSQFPTKQLPGLKTCTKLFSSSWELSKEEQRSDWSKRPLSQSQIQYAALDAAILLFLLAEEYRPELTSSPTSNKGYGVC